MKNILMTEKNQIILACVLPLIAVFIIYSALTNEGPIENSVGDERRQSSLRQQESLTGIYLDIATKFADQQLWQIALEYYHRCYEIDSDDPELAAKIAGIKSKIENQTTYENGSEK
jgi:hypothetical protein